MVSVLIGQRYVWFFTGYKNQRQGRKIANLILYLEQFGWGRELSGFEHPFGVWRAVGRDFEEVEDLLAKIKDSSARERKVIEIKRRRPPKFDALYLTRPQKERWASK